MESKEQQIAHIRQEIQQIRDSLPAHSQHPAQILRLEELEDRLEELMQDRGQEGDAPA